MNNVELMAKISVNAGVASQVARDNIEAMLRNGPALTDKELARIGQMRDRLAEANAAVMELERRARVASIEGPGQFWEAEQFNLFEQTTTPTKGEL